MRIIWLEDFGGSQQPLKKVLLLFKQLIGESIFDDYWDQE